MKLVHSLSWIIGSALFITGGTYKGLRLYQRKHTTTAQTYLCRIIQTGPQREALKTTYLAELMRISADRPMTVASFDLVAAQKRLLSCPVIKEAKVKLTPDTVYVDYTVRQPIAWLYDFENIALDEEGYPFPVSPFFTPKRLPEIYLGIQNFYWGRPLKERKADLALTILQVLNRLSLQVKRLDVSKAFQPSLGRREVVLILEEEGFTKTLRLTPKNFAQELGNYLELRPKLPAVPQIIDLRIPQLAFIQEKKKDMQASEP
jgi:cell division septal protein FtsQ